MHYKETSEMLQDVRHLFSGDPSSLKTIDQAIEAVKVQQASQRGETVIPPSVFESEREKLQASLKSDRVVSYRNVGSLIDIEAGKILLAMAVYEWVLAVGLDADTREAVERDFQILRTLQTQGRRFELRLLKEAEWVLASDDFVLGRPIFRAELEQRFGEIISY